MTIDDDSLTGDDDFADTTESATYRLVELDSSVLANPIVIRAVVGVVVGLAVITWPDRSDRILARLVGLALLGIAVSILYVAARTRRWKSSDALAALVALGCGAFLVASPDRSEAFLGRLLGALVILAAARRVAERIRAGSATAGELLPAAAVASGGALLIALPEETLSVATTLVAIGWVCLSILIIVVSLDGRRDGVASYSDGIAMLSSWLTDRPKSVDARQTLYDKVLFEGPQLVRRVARFFTLMVFASVIASMGVITDSTAVVIGAMLIAPLMTPLMGMAISLVMGWPNRLVISALVAFSGIALAILVGVLAGVWAPTVIDTAVNTQIVARSSPTLLDLVIAVAAGAAGAYGLSRPDVSDSLPGVAIAISLVPPLAVVGISYSQGDWSSGNGALLLFSTNMIAILIVGGLTFVLTGITPISRVAENQHRVRTSLAAVAIASAAVLGALLLNGTHTATTVFEQARVAESVDDWLDTLPDHRLVDATIDRDTVRAVIVGPSGDIDDIDALVADLSERLGREITLDLRLVVEERLTTTTDS